MQQVEIERKWLMECYPDLPHIAEVVQWQAYLSLQPVTVRIRSVESGEKKEYWLTIKGKGGLKRTEVEMKLDEERFSALSQLVETPSAVKRLRTYALPNNHILECSLVDEGEPTAFYYAEVEFSTEEEANAFIPPDYLGREVTGQPGYTMAAYCIEKIKGAQ